MKKHLLLFSLIPLVLGCAVQAPLAPTTKNYWKEFDRGNVFTSEWDRSDCAGQPQHTVLHLTAKKNEIVGCRTTPLGIIPGHYEFSVWLKTQGLGLNPQRYLNEALSIRLRLFDHSGFEIDPIVQHLGQKIDGQDLSYSFNRVARDEQIEALGFTKVHLVPRFYPYDSGWLSSEVGSVALEVTLQGPGEVWLKDFDLRYSKWNFPLRQRVQHLSSLGSVESIPSQTYQLRIASARDVRRTHYQQEITAGEWLAESGFNAFFLDAEISGKGWWPLNQEAVEVLGRLQGKSFITGILINPYLQHDSQGKGSFEFSNKEHLDRFIEVIGVFRKAGVQQVILRFDDFAPRPLQKKFGYFLETRNDRRKFKTLAQAHAYLVKRVQNQFPDLHLYVVPPWYNNIFSDLSDGLGPKYLKELSTLISQQIDIMWTGPTVRSLFIDEIHVRRFSDWIGGRIPILWDNTLYARRNKDFWLKSSTKVQLTSEIEPYSIEIPYASERVYLNAHVTELYRIQLITAGAYFAGPNRYNPEAVLWNYLVENFGAEAAELILAFDEKISLLRKKKLEQGGTEEIDRDLQDIYSRLEDLISEDNPVLLEELKEKLITP